VITCSPLDVLTERELDVLDELARARSNAAIASSLCLSERSVEKYVASILCKLGIVDDGATNRRVSAVLMYVAHRGPTSSAS
jgi:DNA-binding NarL/FixJ family response regulator